MRESTVEGAAGAAEFTMALRLPSASGVAAGDTFRKFRIGGTE